MEKSNNVDVIYLDFAKAFDKVDHGILLNKLKKIGINGKICVWIDNFLSNRQQCVAVNGTTSSEAHERSGIPQGSVLGPLIFLIHISDINYEIADSTVVVVVVVVVVVLYSSSRSSSSSSSSSQDRLIGPLPAKRWPEALMLCR